MRSWVEGLKGMNDNKYNYALGVLKLIAALEVVWIHFGKGGFGLRLAVPVFMFVSFYLLGCRGDGAVGGAYSCGRGAWTLPFGDDG